MIIGMCSAGITYVSDASMGDFSWAVLAARDLLLGHDPYAYPFDVLHFPYPLPAAFAGLPFAFLTDSWIGPLFIFLSATILALGLTQDGTYWRCLLFLSYTYFESLRFIQWSPLLTALAFYPALAWLALIKPNVGIPPLMLTRPSRIGLWISLAILFISILIYPTWPMRWLSQLRPYGGYVPLLVLPFGPLLLLALLRWRAPKSRLLFLMAALPKRAFYDHLPVFLVAETRLQMLVFVVCNWLGFLFLARPLGLSSIVVSTYLPELVIVLQPLLIPLLQRDRILRRLRIR